MKKIICFVYFSIIFLQLLPAQDFSLRLQQVCDSVEKYFYDPVFVQNEFQRIRTQFHGRLGNVKDENSFHDLVNEMLKTFEVSHTQYFLPFEPAYYQIVDLFSRLPIVKTVFGEDSIRYPSIGIFTKKINGRYFVSGVLEGSPAHLGGIFLGDELLKVEGEQFSPVEAFRNKIGDKVKISLRREEEGRVIHLPIRVERSNPTQAFLRAIEKGADIIDIEGKKIAYIRIWSYAGKHFHEAFLNQLQFGKLKDADALVWDLRGGWGGASPEYLNVFNKQVPILSGTDRNGNTFSYDRQWRKPVVMLINEEVRSGKEILAHGFRAFEIGPLVGTKTAGAVVAGRFILMPDRSVLYLASSSVKVDGEILEGKGVEPTLKVMNKLPYSGGHDAQKERAIKMARGLLNK